MHTKGALSIMHATRSIYVIFIYILCTFRRRRANPAVPAAYCVLEQDRVTIADIIQVQNSLKMVKFWGLQCIFFHVQT